MYKFNEMPEVERPYERFFQIGASALTNSELLAIILRNGVMGKDVIELANDILNLCDEGRNISKFMGFDVMDFRKIKGVGRVKAAQLVCIGELARRIHLSNAVKNLSFNNANSVAHYYMESMRHLSYELFMIALLDAKNRLIKDIKLSTGSATATVVSPREVFSHAIKYNAINIIALHNHPSGDCSPSTEDIKITDNLCKIGNMMGIKLIDHIIIGDNCYYSFKEKGNI